MRLTAAPSTGIAPHEKKTGLLIVGGRHCLARSPAFAGSLITVSPLFAGSLVTVSPLFVAGSFLGVPPAALMRRTRCESRRCTRRCPAAPCVGTRSATSERRRSPRIRRERREGCRRSDRADRWRHPGRSIRRCTNRTPIPRRSRSRRTARTRWVDTCPSAAFRADAWLPDPTRKLQCEGLDVVAPRIATGPSDPPRAAFSHSASVGSRAVRPIDVRQPRAIRHGIVVADEHHRVIAVCGRRLAVVPDVRRGELSEHVCRGRRRR